MMDSKGWRVSISVHDSNRSKRDENYIIYLQEYECIEYFDFKRFDSEFSKVEKRIHQLVGKYNILRVNIIAISHREIIFTGWYEYGRVNIYCKGMESIEIKNCSREEFYKVIFEYLEKIREWVKEYSRYGAERICSSKSHKMTKS